jgi:hypothetical protein
MYFSFFSMLYFYLKNNFSEFKNSCNMVLIITEMIQNQAVVYS